MAIIIRDMDMPTQCSQYDPRDKLAKQDEKYAAEIKYWNDVKLENRNAKLYENCDRVEMELHEKEQENATPVIK